MFLKEFSPTEKDSFLSLAKQVIAADGVYAKEEMESWRDILVEMGLDPGYEVDVASIESSCSRIDDPETRIRALMELTSIAFVDGDYADEEREFLRNVANQWAVEPISMVRIEAWAKQRVFLFFEAANIMHEIRGHLAD